MHYSNRLVSAAICYRCHGFGHLSKDCYLPEAGKEFRSCVRCGQPSCKAACRGDWYRFMEGCNRQYSKSDLELARCFVCGKTGHFCCKNTPEVRHRCCTASFWLSLCCASVPVPASTDCPAVVQSVASGCGDVSRPCGVDSMALGTRSQVQELVEKTCCLCGKKGHTGQLTREATGPRMQPT
jgi:hypothetical protein